MLVEGDYWNSPRVIPETARQASLDASRKLLEQFSWSPQRVLYGLPRRKTP